MVPALVTVFRNHTPALALNADVRRTLHELRLDGWRLGLGWVVCILLTIIGLLTAAILPLLPLLVA